MCIASAACVVMNPIYPFPLENNLAWSEFVAAHYDAARYISSHLRPGATIATAFPFANCMRRPEMGYTAQHYEIQDMPDFTRMSLERLRGSNIDALAVFASTWDPLDLMRNPYWMQFLRRFYNYEADFPIEDVPALLGLHRVARFEHRGQWIEIFQP